MADESLDEKLDRLQSEVEKLLSLLKVRETGLSSWWSFVAQRLKAIGEF